MKVNSFILKTLSSISLLWLGSLFGAGIALITQVILAKELTPSDYGVFASAVATISLFVPLASFGVQGYWLKIFGLEGWSALRWLSLSFCFVALCTLFTLFCIAIWANFGPHNNSFRWLLFILLPMVMAYSVIELVGGKFKLEERFTSLALWQLIPHLLRFLFILLFLFTASEGANVYSIGGIYALVALIMIIIGVFQLIAMRYGQFALAGHIKPGANEGNKLNKTALDLSKISLLAKNTWPFAITSLLYLVYFQSDIIILKYLKGDEAAGIYNIGFIIMASVYLLPNAIYQKFLLPKFHRWAYHDRSRFLASYRFGNGCMLLLGTLVAVFIALTTPLIIPSLFDAVYIEAIDVLSILSLCIPLHFLATSIGAALVTNENIRRKVFYIGVAAAINVLLNLKLIPLYGIMGAAYSTLLSEGVLLALYLFAVRKYVFGSDAWYGWNLKLKNFVKEI